MKSKYLFWLLLAAVLLLAVSVSAAASQIIAEPQDGGLMFIENRGQFDPQVRFQAQAGNGTLWVTNDGLWVSMMEMERAGDAETQGMGDAERRGAAMERMEQPVRGVALKLSFVGATPQAVEPFELLETEMSYFLGNDPGKWVSGAPVWAGVRYVDLYPGIDLELSGQAGQLAPKLVVRDPAALGQVRMRIEGGDAVSVMGGQMVVETTLGPLAMPLLAVEGLAPDSLPEVGMVESGVFEMATPLAVSVLEAEVTDQSAMEPLAEDETAAVATTLIFSTYLGGTEWDSAFAVVADNAKTTYVCGLTFSDDFPTKAGNYNTTHNGSDDAFVAKYGLSGKLLAGTFVGGTDGDDCRGLAVNGTKLYFTGGTWSSDFPSAANAFDPSFNGNADTFVGLLNTTLKTLGASTFLGGASWELGRALDVDSSGNVYVVGDTYGDFPTTAGAVQPVFGGGGGDGFVARLNPALTSRTWATYLGGSDFDGANGLAVCGASVYVVGDTYSGNFPKTAGAYDPTYNGRWDGFITKLDANGGLIYSTFMGGTDVDLIEDIAVDSSGRAHVVGTTGSANYPKTGNALQGSLAENSDAVLTVLNAAGNALVYSTFFGGTGGDKGDSVTLDSTPNTYLVGNTDSDNLPLKDPYQTKNKGNGDAFLAKVAATGSGILLSGTYLGGSNGDDSYDAYVDAYGYVLLVGDTWSNNFPIKNPAHGTYDGNEDGFVSRLALAPLKTTMFRDSVYPATSYAGTRDTHVRQANPTTNYGALASLNVDGDEPEASGKDVCTLIKWDISNIASGATVMSAKLTFNITNHSANQVYEIYRVKQNWDEATATWNNQPTHDTKVLGTVGMNTLGLYTINLNATGKSVVQGWVDAPATNYGFWICDSANTNGFDIDSSEAATKANRPKLTVQWVHPAVTTAAPAEEPLMEEGSPEAGWQSLWLPLVNR